MPQEEGPASAPSIERGSVVLPPQRYTSPLRLLILIAASVFVVEALVMILLIVLPLSPAAATLLDAALLTILMYPILYRFVVRPMTRHINERRQAEAALSRAYDEMESRVRERTAELAQANTSLQNEITERQLASAELQVALKTSQQRQAEVVGLLKGARAVLEYRDFEEVAQAILKTCKEVIGATAGYVALPGEDRSNEKIVFLDSGNSARGTDRELQMPIRGLRAQVYSTGQAVCVNEYAGSEWTEALPEEHMGRNNLIMAPMVIRGFVVGLICLADKPGGFSESDVRLTTAFAELAAISQLNSQTLELLENSEKRFRTLAQASFEGIAISENGIIREVNDQFAQTYGYRLSDVIGRPVTDFLVTEQHEQVMRTVTGSEDYVGEYRALRKDGSIVILEAHGRTIEQGGRAVRVTAMRDITERKQTEENLRQSREDLDRAQEVGQIGSWRLDVRHNVLTWSAENHRIFGVPQGTPMTYETFLEVVHPDDREYVNRKWKASLAGEPYDIEHRITASGTIKWVREKAFLEFDQAGALLGGFGITQDITARKHAEERMAWLASFPELNPIPVMEVDLAGHVEYLNPAAKRLLSDPETMGQNHPWLADLETVSQRCQSGIETVITRDVQLNEGVYQQTLSCMSGGQRIRIYCLDITKRQRAEEALRHAHAELELRVQERTHQLATANEKLLAEIDERKAIERQLRLQTTAIEAAANGILITDRQGNIQWNNPAFTHMTGYTTDEALGRNTRILNSHQQTPEFYRHLWETILSGAVWHGELVNRRKDGSLYVEEQTITPVLDQSSQVTHFIAIKHDITERKQAEEALRASEMRFRTVADFTYDWEYWVSPEQQPIYITPSCERVTGYRAAEFVADPELLTRIIYPEDRALYIEHLHTLSQHGDLVPIDFRIVRRDNEVRWIAHVCRPVYDDQGRALGRRISNRDITERKLAEDQLEANNRHLLALSKAERDQRLLAETLAAANLALTQTLNLEAVLGTLLDYVERLVPYDSANVMLLEDEARLSVRIARGYERWGGAESVRAITFNGQTNPIFSQLLTARQSQLVSDTRAQPGWEVQPGIEHVRSWLGVPLVAGGNVIGLFSLDKTEPGFLTAEHVRMAELLAGQAAVAIQNAWLYEQVRAGRERLKSLSRRLVEVQEAERQYIARELHDEAGQALTSLLFGLSQIEQQPDSQRQAIQILELKERTNDIIQNLHRLAMDLRPVSLDQLGLIPALLQQVKAVGDRYGLVARFKAVGMESNRLRPEVETALYRIVQEALTNSVRHAGATCIDVVLERRGERVVTIVEDNGHGFDAETTRSMHVGHLGLAGMQERAEMLGGALVIESIAGRGTTIVVEVPNDNSNLDRR